MILKVRGIEVIHKNESKKRLKIEGQDGLPLDFEFWWIWKGSGRPVGMENRAKSEEKSNESGEGR